jgi:hypothetical protein
LGCSPAGERTFTPGGALSIGINGSFAELDLDRGAFIAAYRGNTSKLAWRAAWWGGLSFVPFALFQPWPRGLLAALVYPVFMYPFTLLLGWASRVTVCANGLQVGRIFVRWEEVRNVTLIEEGDFSRVSLFTDEKDVDLPLGLVHRQDFAHVVASVAPANHPLLKFVGKV